MTLTLGNKPIVIPDAVRRKAGLRRGDRVKFKVSGRAITILPESPVARDYPLTTVNRIIKASKDAPMTRRQSAAVDRELATYGAKQAKKLGVKEGDIPRIVHDSRARRRSS